MGDSLFEFEESDISENEKRSNSTEGNIGPSSSTLVSLPGAAKQIFDGYCPIAPISTDVRDSGEDSDRDTGSETFWDQFEVMRGIMLMAENRDDFDFSKKEVTTFNEKARKRIKSLVSTIILPEILLFGSLLKTQSILHCWLTYLNSIFLVYLLSRILIKTCEKTDSLSAAKFTRLYPQERICESPCMH